MSGIVPETKAPDIKNIKEEGLSKEVAEALAGQRKEFEDRFKNVPAPVDFGKLQSDVEHHGRLIYPMLIGSGTSVVAVVGLLIAAFIHFDGKIDGAGNVFVEKMDGIHKSFAQLERDVKTDFSYINRRIDSIITPNYKESAEPSAQEPKIDTP